MYKENPFTCAEYGDYPGPIVPFVEGNFFYPSLPYLRLSAFAFHLILWILMTSCFSKQLLPSN